MTNESTTTADTLELLVPVLDDLSTVADGVHQHQRGAPTPCAQYDVAALTGHIVGWLENFAAGFAADTGHCPTADVAGVRVPGAEAAPRIRSAAKTLRDAVRAGATARPLVIAGQGGLPGDMALSMILGEYIVHGWDLARATGQQWAPHPDAATTARQFLTTMLAPEHRTPAGGFGPEVPVAQDAPALDRLLGFTGRDPRWSA